MRPDPAIKGLQRRIAKLERQMPDPQPPPGRNDIIKLMCADAVLMDFHHDLLQLLCEREPEHAHLPIPTEAEVQAAVSRFDQRLAELDAGAVRVPRTLYGKQETQENLGGN
jgi:hypothetical protein